MIYFNNWYTYFKQMKKNCKPRVKKIIINITHRNLSKKEQYLAVNYFSNV